MTARQSSATERALARVAAGQTAYAAARAEGIALSTIYRAIKRQSEGGKKHENVETGTVRHA